MNNKYCTKCGNTLKSGVKFCGKCGTKVVDELSVPVFSTQETQQQQLNAYRLAISAEYKKGLLSAKGCSIIFSNSAILIAMVDKTLMKQHIASVRENARNDGFFKKTTAVMKAGFSYAQRYMTMTRDNIMAEHPDNFYIANNTIELIKFKRGNTYYNTNDTMGTTPPTLTVKCPGGKYTFNMNASSDNKLLIQVLRELFPGRYKGPKK